jgi:hypothetical protein
LSSTTLIGRVEIQNETGFNIKGRQAKPFSKEMAGC